MKKGILLGLFLFPFFSTLFGQTPTLVKDICPLRCSGLAFTYSESFFLNGSISNGNLLIFTANNSSNGTEPWKSDGTEEGTVMLKDIVQGDNIASSAPGAYFVHKGIVYFRGRDSAFPQTLFRTDGTEKGTFSIWSDNELQYSQGFKIDTSYYFQTSTAIINKSLTNNSFKTLLNAKTSTKFSQFNGSPFVKLDVSKYSTITKFNNKWVVVAFDSLGRKSLFSSDETQLGTKIIRPLNLFDEFYKIKNNKPTGLIFFAHDDGNNGRELWKTDGTENGTKLVKNIAPSGLSSIDPSWQFDLNNVKGGVVFTADNGVNGKELWFSDGSENGTKMIKEFTTGISGTNFTKFINFGADDDVVYFTIGRNELWKTDGTSEGTTLILKTNNLFSIDSNSKETFFEQSGGFIYFLISVGTNVELWRTDGNSNNTVKLTTLNNCTSAPYFRIAGNNFFYAGSDTQAGFELWKFPLCTHTAKINTPNGTSFCTGGSINIIGEATGTTNTFTYKWKQGSNDLGTATTLTVTKAGTYTLDVTDKGGCTVSASIDISLTANLPVNITGTNNFCAGQSTTLTANVTGGVSPFTFQWKNNTANVGTNANTLIASAGGAYNVNITDSKGCTGTSPNYAVTQNPSPNVTIIKSGATDLLTGGSVVLSVPSATNQTYQWLKDGIVISGATNNSYTANGAGKFSVTVIANGCSATSEAVTVSIILANELPSESENFKVSPNPFENTIKVNFNQPLTKTAKLNLISSIGIVLKEWTTNQQENSFDILGLPSGIYILKCEIKDKIEAVKLIKN